MRKKIKLFFLILLCSFCLFIPYTIYAEDTQALADNQIKLKTFNNKRDDISIKYPEGWFIKEYKYNNPYSIFLSREKVEKPTDLFKVGISIWKFYHQSWYMGMDSGNIDESLNFLLDNYNKNISYPNKKVGQIKNVVIDGARALKEEISFDTLGGYRNKMFVIYAMKDDVIVHLLYEASEDEFEQYRQAFEESIKTAKIFSSDDMLSDNLLLDREIDQMLIVDTKLGRKAGNTTKVLSVFKDALSMNPSYAKARFLYGNFLMHCAKSITGKEQKEILKVAEKELRLAVELYNKYLQDYPKVDRKLNISQCYFLLGDIYYFPYDNKEEAKKLYKESLKFFEHDGAKKALEEYFKK